MGPSIDRNFTRWPTLGTYVWPNYYVFDTYEEEIEYLKSWTADRLQWMDQEMLSIADVSIIPKKYRLYDAYPNPFNPTTLLRYDLPQKSKVIIHSAPVLVLHVLRFTWSRVHQRPLKLGTHVDFDTILLSLIHI